MFVQMPCQKYVQTFPRILFLSCIWIFLDILTRVNRLRFAADSAETALPSGQCYISSNSRNSRNPRHCSCFSGDCRLVRHRDRGIDSSGRVLVQVSVCSWSRAGAGQWQRTSSCLLDDAGFRLLFRCTRWSFWVEISSLLCDIKWCWCCSWQVMGWCAKRNISKTPHYTHLRVTHCATHFGCGMFYSE